MEQAIGKTSGASANVETEHALRLDAEVVQRTFELQATTAHELAWFTPNAQRGPVAHRRAALLRLLLVDQHSASKDERLGLLARFSQSAFHQQSVEPDSIHA